MEKLFCKILYSLVYFLGTILDFIQEMLGYLVGLKQLGFSNDAGASTSKSGLLGTIVSDSNVQRFFFFMIALSFFVLLLLTVLRLWSVNFKDSGVTPKRAVSSAVKGFLSMVSLMAIVFFAIFALNLLMGGLGKALSGDGTISLGWSIIESCLPENIMNGAPLNAFKANYSWANLTALTSEVGTTPWKDFEYFPAIVMLALTLVPVGSAIVVVARKLFTVVQCFAISPIIVSNYPLDDGEGFKEWRTTMLSDLIGAGIVAVCFAMFTLTIPTLQSIDFNEITKGNNTMKVVAQTLLIVGGGFATLEIADLISKMLGANGIKVRGNVSELKARHNGEVQRARAGQTSQGGHSKTDRKGAEIKAQQTKARIQNLGGTQSRVESGGAGSSAKGNIYKVHKTTAQFKSKPKADKGIADKIERKKVVTQSTRQSSKVKLRQPTNILKRK